MIPESELNKALLTMKIIWFSMLLSLAVYLLVGILVAKNLEPSLDQPVLATVKTILYAAAFLALIATRHVRRLILSGKALTAAGAGQSQHPVLQKYATATVTALAMSEFIGVCGLVVYLLGKNAAEFYLMILISAVAVASYRPGKDELLLLAGESRGEAAAGARER